MVIQWFPGHMAKTKRMIEKNLKLVDAVAEIIDARIPVSSRNPDLNSLLKGKPRVIIINKCDIADEKETKKWRDYYKSKHINSVIVDCKRGKGINQFKNAFKSLMSDKINSLKQKGIINYNIRIMVLGIPNVGKSSFINRVAKSKKAKVENRPGVTRSDQWFFIGDGFELMDTPGVLWPKFDDILTGKHLAFTGAIKDQIIDIEQLAIDLLKILKEKYPENLKQRYKLTDSNLFIDEESEILELIAKKRGMLISKGQADLERASAMLLDEFRSCKLGRITLETVR